MGQKDLAQNDYFADRDRFADVCNGILFEGEQIVKAEELWEADRLDAIKNIMESIGKTAVEAMDILKIPESECEQYMELLK